MLSPTEFLRHLQDHDVTFFTGVPDSLLKEFCACIAQNVSPAMHVIAANEGGAVALGIGYHMATGKLPLIYLQNSGLGNTINPLLSLSDPEIYSIPMILLIGWRGGPGGKDEPQHKKQGRVTLSLLETLGIPYSVLDASMDNAEAAIAEAVTTARAQLAPYALVVRNGTFDYHPVSTDERRYPMQREDAIKLLVNALGERDIVVSTTGMLSRELFEFRDILGQSHQQDFLTIGGMGHASQIALGIAMQKPERQVICLDGDGSVLMHLGSLAINGTSGCTNFKHIVINNGAHDSVGGQPTVAQQVDLASTARALGYQYAVSTRAPQELIQQLRAFRETAGPALLEIMVDKGNRPDLGRPTVHPLQNKQRFQEFVRT